MEMEFDKEIDSLIRQTARLESSAFESGLQSQIAHLDADEISSFAENALPEKAKKRLTEHFAICDPCRIVLADVIRLNAAEEPVLAGVEEKQLAHVKPSWIQNLFGFRNLAFSMGALIVVFAGLTVFIAFRNLNSGDAEIAKADTKAPAAILEKAASAPAASNSNASIANGNTIDDAIVFPESNKDNSVVFDSEDAIRQSGPNVSKDLNAAPERREMENRSPAERPAPAPTPAIALGRIIADESLSDRDEDKMVAEENSAEPSAASKPAPPTGERKNDVADKKETVFTTRGAQNDDISLAAKRKQAPESRKIGGKSFIQQDGVWVDSAYTNQSIINVERGSVEYKKLDSELRSLAEKFADPVVIIWKAKGYKFQ